MQKNSGPMSPQDTTKKRTAAVPDLPQEQLQDQMGPSTRSTSSIPPALSTTECLAAEDTNSDPCFIRSTFYVLPASNNILDATGLPLAIVATPFSDRGLSPSLPEAPRCSSCETYLNFFTHRNGQSLICNICGHVLEPTSSAALDLPTFEIERPSSTSQGIASSSVTKLPGTETSASGKIPGSQLSAAQNDLSSITPPSLSTSGDVTYRPASSKPPGASQKDLNGAGSLCSQRHEKPSFKAAFIFVFDLSLPAAPYLAKEALSICTDSSFEHLYSHVGFFVINSDVSVFSVASDGNIVRTRIHGTSSRLSPFSLVPTRDVSSITTILNTISEERLDMRPDLVPKFLDILQTLSGAFCGIKVLLLSRSVSQTYNYEKFLESVKNTMISVITERERETADSVRKKSTSLFNNNSIHALAFHSGGRVSFFKRNELVPMSCEMRRVALARTAFRVSLRLKVSDGFTKAGVISSAIEENLIVTRLNGMEAYDAVTFELALHEETSGASSSSASGSARRQHGATKYCQLQVLYTDNEGRELRRIFNHAYATGDAAQCFMALSFETIFAVLCKVQALSGESTEKSAESVLVRSLAFYRRHCAALTSSACSRGERTSSPGSALSSSQIVLPDSLKCLPVLIQAIDKNSGDWGMSIIKADVEKTVRYFYPRLFSLVEFSIAGRLAITPCLRLTGREIKDDEIYVAENGTEILVYVGRDVDLALIETFFLQKEGAEEANKESVESETPTAFVSGKGAGIKEDSEKSALAERFSVEGPFALKQTEKEGEAAALCEALRQIMSHYGQEMCVRVVVATEQSDEARFMAYMVEDSVNSRPDYVDYVFGLHFKIQRA